MRAAVNCMGVLIPSLPLCYACNQDTLAKFKRLLSLARRSIEENQRQITEKDGQLAALREALGAAENARRRCDLSRRVFLRHGRAV